MKIVNALKKENILLYSLLIFMVIQPILELDVYLQEFYDKLGILALSTIIRILGVVFLAFLAWMRSSNKKRDIILWGIYGLILGAYTVFHIFVSRSVAVNLPSSYQWVGSFELKYILFLIIPFLLIWTTSRVKITKNEFNTIILFVSLFICLNIFITNILVSSYGSYGNITYQNIFTWFTGAYEEYTPRELSSIGFFFYANPISGLLIITLPLLVKAMVEEKKKWLYAGAIFIQTMTMFMLGTRVGAYGTIIGLAVTLVVYLFYFVIRQIKSLDKVFIVFIALMSILSVVILPYSPAYRNSSFDYDDEVSFSDNERNLKESLAALDKDSEDYNFKLIWELEHTYIFYLTFPKEYYEYYYSYKFDPEFYFDVLSLPFEQRKGGRQFQQYFMDRKFDELTSFQKLSGLGYSRMSQGGIVLEQDFKRQYYVLGSIGMVITVAPYLLLFAYFGLKLLKEIRNPRVFNFENAILFMSFSLGLIIAYYSGHVLDEPIASLFIALVAGRLFRQMRLKNEEA